MEIVHSYRLAHVYFLVGSERDYNLFIVSQSDIADIEDFHVKIFIRD